MTLLKNYNICNINIINSQKNKKIHTYAQLRDAAGEIKGLFGASIERNILERPIKDRDHIYIYFYSIRHYLDFSYRRDLDFGSKEKFTHYTIQEYFHPILMAKINISANREDFQAIIDHKDANSLSKAIMRFASKNIDQAITHYSQKGHSQPLSNQNKKLKRYSLNFDDIELLYQEERKITEKNTAKDFFFKEKNKEKIFKIEDIEFETALYVLDTKPFGLKENYQNQKLIDIITKPDGHFTKIAHFKDTDHKISESFESVRNQLKEIFHIEETLEAFHQTFHVLRGHKLGCFVTKEKDIAIKYNDNTHIVCDKKDILKICEKTWTPHSTISDMNNIRSTRIYQWKYHSEETFNKFISIWYGFWYGSNTKREISSHDFIDIYQAMLNTWNKTYKK